MISWTEDSIESWLMVQLRSIIAPWWMAVQFRSRRFEQIKNGHSVHLDSLSNLFNGTRNGTMIAVVWWSTIKDISWACRIRRQGNSCESTNLEQLRTALGKKIDQLLSGGNLKNYNITITNMMVPEEVPLVDKEVLGPIGDALLGSCKQQSTIALVYKNMTMDGRRLEVWGNKVQRSIINFTKMVTMKWEQCGHACLHWEQNTQTPYLMQGWKYRETILVWSWDFQSIRQEDAGGTSRVIAS